MVWKWRGAVDTVVKLDISNLRVPYHQRGKLKSVAELEMRTIPLISVDIIELDIVSAHEFRDYGYSDFVVMEPKFVMFVIFGVV